MQQKIIHGLALVLGLYFIAIACMGLIGAEPIVKTFDAIGIGQWFRYVTAICQLAGGVMLLGTHTRMFGALIVSGVLSGAIVARVFAMHANLLVAIVLLGIALVILYDGASVKRRAAAA